MVSTNRACFILHRCWRDSVVARALYMAGNLSRRCGHQEPLLCVVETRTKSQHEPRFGIGGDVPRCLARKACGRADKGSTQGPLWLHTDTGGSQALLASE